jgi:hypothetical protein
MVKRNLDGLSEAHLPQKFCAQGQANAFWLGRISSKRRNKNWNSEAQARRKQFASKE